MQVTRKFYGDGDRYALDWNGCSSKKGFAQVDTNQDAWYFGTWANPSKLVIVTYAEGDLTIERADTEAEFVERIRSMAQWNTENEYGFAIDPMCVPEIESAFKSLGLGDLLH